MIITKRVDLPLLQQELAAATIIVPGLGTFLDEQQQTNLHTYDDTGTQLALPPEAEPVVDAHVAPPLVTEFAAATETDGVIRTTDGVTHELLRLPLSTMTGYDIEAKVMGVDAGNGAVKKLKVDVTVKRLAAGPVQVGAMTSLVTHQDPAASSWTVGFSFSGNDALISVTGAAGRSIDWIARAFVGRFSPGGLGT
jgi:hypothetical protein